MGVIRCIAGRELRSYFATPLAYVFIVIFLALTGLFTFYLVADAPGFRRAVCSVLPPQRQREVLSAWEVAVDKTGGYLYSRLLLAMISAFFAFVVLTALGVPFAVPLALFLGFVSQFIPVVGTYIAGVLPVVVMLVNPGSSPVRALVAFGFIVVYQQIENYLFAPRITARTMELHPAVAFGAALAGFELLGAAGGLLALPAAAMLQAISGEWGERHDVIEDHLTELSVPGRRRADT